MHLLSQHGVQTGSEEELITEANASICEMDFSFQSLSRAGRLSPGRIAAADTGLLTAFSICKLSRLIHASGESWRRLICCFPFLNSHRGLFILRLNCSESQLEGKQSCTFSQQFATS